MKIFTLIFFLLLGTMASFSQKKELKAKDVPKEVVIVLNEYMKILTTSATLEECVTRMESIAGGGLVTNSGMITKDAQQFSLKKDYNNAKFYKYPVEITRVQYSKEDYDGYKETLIQGERYKIWIAKKDSKQGMPAPVPIIVPKSGKPKIVTTIGNM